MKAVWVVLSISGLAVAAWGQAAPQAVPGEYIVGYRSAAEDGLSALTRGASGGFVMRTVTPGVNVVRWATSDSARWALSTLRSNPNVAYVEPNYRVKAFGFNTNDPARGEQYGWNQLSLPAAWETAKGDASVVIAIVDTGVRLNHPDLVNKLVSGFDFVDNDAVPADGHGHGTHCAGVAGADTNNGIGVAGAGFNCRIMPIRVLGNNGAGDVATVAQGITWAADRGAKVISLSLGGSGQSQTLLNSIRYAATKGAIVIAAAGNDGRSTPTYPAAYTEVLAVGATNETRTRAYFSNYGSWVDVAAPGDQIYSTTFDSAYGYMSGTSMATPAVAGVAGLVYAQLGASATPSAVRARIEETADRSSAGWTARGLVNAALAVAASSQTQTVAFTSSTPEVVAGASVRLTIATSGLTNGATFSLASNNAAVQVPASVALKRGQRTISFAVRTQDVSSGTPVTLTLSREGANYTTTVNVTPNSLKEIGIRSEIRGSGTATMTITLQQALAGPNSLTVNLSSTPEGTLSLPATVTFRPGQRSLTRLVTVRPVSSTTNVSISATANGVTRTVTTRVIPRN